MTSSTTIGKYIARFRQEKPRSREERQHELKREDFWWTGAKSVSETSSKHSWEDELLCSEPDSSSISSIPSLLDSISEKSSPVLVSESKDIENDPPSPCSSSVFDFTSESLQELPIEDPEMVIQRVRKRLGMVQMQPLPNLHPVFNRDGLPPRGAQLSITDLSIETHEEDENESSRASNSLAETFSPLVFSESLANLNEMAPRNEKSHIDPQLESINMEPNIVRESKQDIDVNESRQCEENNYPSPVETLDSLVSFVVHTWGEETREDSLPLIGHDDPIVQMLQRRIELYEEALRRISV